MRRCAVVIGIALATACGGKTVSGRGAESHDGGSRDSSANTSEVGPGVDASTPGTGGTFIADAGSMSAPPPAATVTEAQARACAHYAGSSLSVVYGCFLTAPASELERRQKVIAGDCTTRFTMPGNAVTPSGLEACAAALEIIGCGNSDAPPPECDFRGTLEEGAACHSSEQCASGLCTPVSAWGETCGHCAGLVGLGDDCSTGGCPRVAACLPRSQSAESYTCVAQTFGSADAACDGNAMLCRPGLGCTNGRCLPFRQEGDTCDNRNTWCIDPLYCSSAGRCTAPGTEGQSCAGDESCAHGLVCDPDTWQCVSPRWVGSGEPCSLVATQCLFGGCIYQGDTRAGVCSTVVAEGGSCNQLERICDIGLVCLDGTCRGAHAAVCH